MANIRKELVLAFVEKYHPPSVEALKARLDQEGIGSTDEALLEVIRELVSDGTLQLRHPAGRSSFVFFMGYLPGSWWIYTTMLVSVSETLLVAYGVTIGILGSIRAFFGLGLLGFLPGYVTVRALFPGNQLKSLESMLLSIFLSITVSIAIGVALGAGYLFTAFNSVLGSSVYTILAGLIAGYREYSVLKPNSKTRLQSA